MKHLALLAILMAGLQLRAAEAFSIYDLNPPSTHSFDIVYDVSSEREGAAFFFNPIRPGSVSTNERVLDLFTGKPASIEAMREAVGRGRRAEPQPGG